MFNYSSRDIIDQTEMIVSVMSVSICLVFWNMIYFVCSTTQTGSMALSPFACRSFQGLNSGLFVVRASCTSACGGESALAENSGDKDLSCRCFSVLVFFLARAQDLKWEGIHNCSVI